jgi:lycopene cyclase domain-containing protein
VPEYTAAAVAAPVLVVALELAVLRTGLLRTARYWVTVGIVLGCQLPVDGWLTRPDAAVVHYQPAAVSGLRVPPAIPVEDFGFGYALVTLTLLGWRWYALRAGRERRAPAGGGPATATATATPPAPVAGVEGGGRG